MDRCVLFQGSAGPTALQHHKTPEDIDSMYFYRWNKINQASQQETLEQNGQKKKQKKKKGNKIASLC